MSNYEIYKLFFESVKHSIQKGTFAKLTLAKTIGNTDLMNVYLRIAILNSKIGFEITFKYQQEEKIQNCSVDEAFELILPYMNNPFMSMLLFTNQADITLKLNKKRIATITEKSPTFKNASEILLDYNLKQIEF